jgi:nitrogen fixation-related uncharacterized protein
MKMEDNYMFLLGILGIIILASFIVFFIGVNSNQYNEKSSKKPYILIN